MSINHDFNPSIHSTYIQSNQDNIRSNYTKLSQKHPVTSFSMSFGKADNNIHKNSVYGYGDVPGNEGTRLKNHPEDYSSGKKKLASESADKKELVSSEIDKRQRLLDWLKASQAKRDENNRQLFSRWIEKMDHMKAQAREQTSCPTLYCDCQQPPHTLFSAVQGYQGEAMSNPDIFFDSPIICQTQQEITHGQNFEYHLKQSQQSIEWSTFTDFGYRLPGFVCNHELYEQMHAFRQQKKFEKDYANSEMSAVSASAALNLGAMVFPYPSMYFFLPNHNEQNVADIREHDVRWDFLSGLDYKMFSPPLLCQPEFSLMLQFPPDHPPLISLISVPFYPSNDGPNASIQTCELGKFCNQSNSNIAFDMKWSSMLEDIGSKADLKNSQITKQGNSKVTVESNSRCLEKRIGEKDEITEKAMLKSKVGNG